MDRLLRDLRDALRGLTRTRTTTIAALLTLALALGVTTTLMSVLDGVLLRPLPYPDSGQLVLVSEHHPGADAPLPGRRLSNLTLDAWDHAQTLDGIGTYGPRTYTWVTHEGAQRVAGASVSPGLFDVLRVPPYRGRFFTAAEAEKGADAVAVLSHALWQELFGGEDAAIGRTLRLDDRDYTIVGVAPPGFAFPDRESRLWTPAVRVPKPAGDSDMPMQIFSAVARLRPGVTPERAAAEATAAARTVKRPIVAELLFGRGGGPVEVRVTRLLDAITDDVKPALLAVTAGVVLVMLVACFNVANLLLSNGLTRRRELAVRAALGASQGRLLRVMLLESLLLAGAGIALGLMLAAFLVDALPALAPERFPRLDEIAINKRVLLASIVTSLASAVIAGLLPAWRGSRTDLALAMKDDDGRSAGMANARLRSALLALEAALALVLIVGAGLLVRSLGKLTEVDHGYDPSNVLTARVYLTGASDKPERRSAIVGELLQRLRALPNVAAAGAGNMAPFGESVYMSAFSLPTPGPGGEERVAQAVSSVVTPGFAEALGLRLVEGRTFLPTDQAESTPLLVSETFARRYLHDGRPVAGRPFPVRFNDEMAATFIAGVVKDIRPFGPQSEPRAEIYQLEGTGRPIQREINLVIRTNGDPLAIVPALREIVRSTDPYAALDEVGTMAARLSASIATPRFFTTVLGSFAGLALVLASVGLYGVLSYGVTLRRRELGVRAALGASRGDLIRTVLRQGFAATLAGLTLGTVLAVWAARMLRGLLFGIEPLDLPAFASGCLVLLAVAAAACLIPARRAASTDPLEVLRHE